MLDKFVYKVFTKYFQGVHKFHECKKEVFHYLPIVRNYYIFFDLIVRKTFFLTKYKILASQE